MIYFEDILPDNGVASVRCLCFNSRNKEEDEEEEEEKKEMK